MAFDTSNAILASTFPIDAISEAADLSNGTAPVAPFFGTNQTGGNPFLSVTGRVVADDASQWRKVSSPSSTTLLGKQVQFSGKGSFFRGVVIAVVGIELTTTGGGGALTDCAYVLGQMGNRFIARLTDLTILN